MRRACGRVEGSVRQAGCLLGSNLCANQKKKRRNLVLGVFFGISFQLFFLAHFLAGSGSGSSRRARLKLQLVARARGACQCCATGTPKSGPKCCKARAPREGRLFFLFFLFSFFFSFLVASSHKSLKCLASRAKYILRFVLLRKFHDSWRGQGAAMPPAPSPTQQAGNAKVPSSPTHTLNAASGWHWGLGLGVGGCLR